MALEKFQSSGYRVVAKRPASNMRAGLLAQLKHGIRTHTLQNGETIMKVVLRKEDVTSGMFKKTTEYCLFVKVELSEEETGAIKKAGIEGLILMPYSYKGLELDWKVSSVVYSSSKGSESRFVAANGIQRNEMEQTVKEQLAALKSQIAAQLADKTGSETFEL
jgi:hypothetical protein